MYTYPNNPYVHDVSLNKQDLNSESIKITDEIPLPNNRENSTENLTEDSPEAPARNNARHRPSIIDFLKERITIEELILIGVIFVLFLEGVEEEFLILMLVYILIF